MNFRISELLIYLLHLCSEFEVLWLSTPVVVVLFIIQCSADSQNFAVYAEDVELYKYDISKILGFEKIGGH